VQFLRDLREKFQLPSKGARQKIRKIQQFEWFSRDGFLIFKRRGTGVQPHGQLAIRIVNELMD